MSVINTMLKDLENRGATGEAEREPVLQGLRSMHVPVPRRAGTLVIGAAGALSTVALLYAVYLLAPYRLVSDIDADVRGTDVSVVQASNERTPQDRMQSASEEEAAMADRSGAPAVTANTPDTITVSAVAEAKPVRPATPAVSRVQQSEPAAVHDAQVESQPLTLQAAIGEAAQKPEAVQQTATEQSADRPEAKPVRLATAQVSAEMMPQQEGEEDDTDLIVTKKQRALTDREKSTQAFAIALQHYEQGDRQQAKASLREALGHDAANVAARRLLAGIHLETGLPEIALETIEAGLQKSGNDRELMQLHLQINVQLDNYARAIEVMQQLRPSTPDEFGYLAGLYQKNDDHRNAVNYYSRALQLKPDQSVWWMGQGISLEALGKYNEALQSYTQSVNAGRLNSQLTEFVANRIISIEQRLESRDS